MVARKEQNWIFNDSIEKESVSEGVYRKVLAYCDEAMCVENHFKSGAVGAVHSHSHTQIAYVAEGEFEFTIGGEKHIVRKGDALLMKDGVLHGCVCIQEGILIDFFTPMRTDFVNAPET